jgi:transcriptional regulator with XRE-family HTH domain
MTAVIASAGLSRSAFAREVGLDRSTLSQIMSPTNQRLPRLETLVAIATAAQVSIDWLVGLSESGGLTADLMHQDVEFQPRARTKADTRLAEWHAEAIGYKIRYVPASLPDLLKIDDVIEYEFRDFATTSPEQRRETRQEQLDYQRRPETDMEVCSPIQLVEGFARGEGIWRALSVDTRRRQLEHAISISRELYPTFRWFFYDVRHRYSAPMTIFGPLRAAVYLGQRYLVLNSREHIKALTAHFDDLIRAAVVQPPDVPARLESLLDEL